VTGPTGGPESYPEAPVPTDCSQVRNWPLWWFARLEAAVERGDFAGAAGAQRELERLGVTVRYRGGRPQRPATAGEEGASAS
jgi:hypothetical protein